MSDPRPAVLSVRDLAVALPPGADRELAVEHISFDVGAGEIVCLLGESGSGKSVISFAVMGLLPDNVHVSAGEIRLGDTNLLALTPAQLRELRGDEHLEPFDMSSADIDEPDQLGVLDDEEPSEATQRVVRDIHGCWAHRHGELIQITPRRGREQRGLRDDEIPVVMPACAVVGGLVGGFVDGGEGAHRRIPTLVSIRSLAR